MKILKPIITNIILILFLFYLNNNVAYAYTEQTNCIVSEVKIEEQGQILGYGDTLHLSCKIESEYQIDKVVFWISTYSKNVSFDMEYDINSGKYIKNQILNEDMLEAAYRTFLIDIWYIKDGKKYNETVYTDKDFPEQCFVFNNNCKNNNHLYDNGKITKLVTCKDDGIKTYTCSVCGSTKIEYIPASENYHKIVIDNAIEVSYINNGFTEGSHCSICGKIIKEQKLIPKLLNIINKNQKITVKKNNYTYKSKSFKNKKITFKIKPKVLGKCKISYKIKQYPKNAKKYISVNNSGKVILKKGIKKGKYKISVIASESKEYQRTGRTNIKTTIIQYKKAVKTITIKIK